MGTLAIVPPVTAAALARAESVGRRRAAVLGVATLAVLIVLFLLVYPHANAHYGSSSGSDRDEAANLGARNLLHGREPYQGKTYLGNPISDLPGALLFALPFVWVLGNSAYQSFVWLPLAFLRLRVVAASTAAALVIAWIVLAASPGLLRELLTGGDLLANCLWVPLLILAVLDAAPRDRRLELAASAALGVGLSSRANFLLAVPLLFGTLARNYGVRRAVMDVAVAATTFLAVTLPFYIADPSGFTPLKVQNRLTQFDSVVPHANVLVGCVAVLLALALSTRPLDARGTCAMGYSAVVQAWPIAAAVLLASADKHALDFTFLVSSYGLTVLGFALFAAAGLLHAKRG